MIKYQLKDLNPKQIKSVGLLNTAADFALGLKRYDFLHTFYDVVKNKFCYKPLFFTMNFPSMAKSLWGNGLSDCAIIFNYNSGEFRTNPSMAEIQKCLEKYSNFDSVAMSVFSGSSKDEVIKLFERGINPSGILFGSSNKENIMSNVKFFRDMK